MRPLKPILERGRRNASVVTICRVARVLDVPPAALLEGIEWVGTEEAEDGEPAGG